MHLKELEVLSDEIEHLFLCVGVTYVYMHTYVYMVILVLYFHPYFLSFTYFDRLIKSVYWYNMCLVSLLLNILYLLYFLYKIYICFTFLHVLFWVMMLIVFPQWFSLDFDLLKCSKLIFLFKFYFSSIFNWTL